METKPIPTSVGDEQLRARRDLHDMRARRHPLSDLQGGGPSEDSRSRRLAIALANFECPKCGPSPFPKVYCTRGRVRHVRCTKCGATDKVVCP